jgi:DNA replication protein DnaC
MKMVSMKQILKKNNFKNHNKNFKRRIKKDAILCFKSIEDPSEC